MWAIVTVVEESTIAITNQLSHFNELGSSNSQTVSTPHNPFISQQISQLENNQVRYSCDLFYNIYLLLKCK